MRLFNNFQPIVGDKFNLNLRQLKQAKERLSGYNSQWVQIFFEVSKYASKQLGLKKPCFRKISFKILLNRFS